MHEQRTIRRPACHKRPDVRASIDATTDEVVKAVYLECLAEGVYPSVRLISRRAGMCNHLASDARARLIDAGAVPISASGYTSNMEVDDPYSEQPDAPEAPEVEARIAVIRAEKEREAAAATHEYGLVMTARYRRPRGKRLPA